MDGDMAVPVTDRNSDEFRNFGFQGAIRAAAIGLTAAPFNTTTDLEFIPHMDGFPNGRRLEDDATTIELQAVGGLVLAAVGLPFDDAVAADYSDLASPALIAELTYNAGPTANDVPLLSSFPYQATPHRGYDYVKQLTTAPPSAAPRIAPRQGFLGVSAPDAFILEQNYPNPFNPATSIQYRLKEAAPVKVRVYDMLGRVVATLADGPHAAGTHEVQWDASHLASGTYFYRIEANGKVLATKKALLVK